MRKCAVVLLAFMAVSAVSAARAGDGESFDPIEQAEFVAEDPAATDSETTSPLPAAGPLPEETVAGPALPKKPPPNPHKALYYENDFRYLDDPDNEFRYLGDFAKRRRLGDWGVLDVGGEFRLRQHHERILTRFDNFLLQRTRVYGDLHVQDWFRFYAEAHDAVSYWGDLPPRPIEENRFDALNLLPIGGYGTGAKATCGCAAVARNCFMVPSG
jgi:hypothetical protein